MLESFGVVDSPPP